MAAAAGEVKGMALKPETAGQPLRGWMQPAGHQWDSPKLKDSELCYNDVSGRELTLNITSVWRCLN